MDTLSLTRSPNASTANDESVVVADGFIVY